MLLRIQRVKIPVLQDCLWEASRLAGERDYVGVLVRHKMDSAEAWPLEVAERLGGIFALGPVKAHSRLLR